MFPWEAANKSPLLVQWSGFLTPTETGEFIIGLRFEGGFARVLVDGKQVAQGFGGPGQVESKTGRVRFEQGKKVEIKVNYSLGTGEPKLGTVDLVEV
jgi:beta-glucosidase